jgi:dienelactone hydrolase
MSEVIPREYLRFWISRGFAVVAPARPGYGKTGGIDREIPGHSWSAVGACQGKPNPEQVANAAGAALLATMTWIREQPWIDNSKMILSGNSVGGLAIVSLGSTALSGVVGYVNFAGGVAGNPVLSPKRSCAPETVRDAYEKYGKSTRVPNLWIYAENDLFWGAEVPKEWHAAFAAGGSKTKLVTTAALPAQDGHELIFVGRSVWSPYVEDFLKQIGFN